MKNNKYANSFIFDEPYVYKGLKIYPIRLKDVLFFNFAVECLLVDKNSIPDPIVISMTYLDYLFNYADEKNKYIERLLGLFYLCTKTEVENMRVEKDAKKHTLFIGDCKVTSEDFETIKEIILEQNLVDVPDYSIQKEIRDRIDEGKRIKSRMSGSKPASLEDQIVSLSVATGVPLEQIYEMSYRKFSKAIDRTDLFVHYKIYLQSSLSGLVEFKDKSFIKHWLNDLSNDNNTDLLELDAVKKKMNFEDKKNNGGK